MRNRVTKIKRRGIYALKRHILALACCVLVTLLAPAQSVNGRITGAVTDQAGGVIRNATVTVTNEGTGAQRRVTTDENGLYVVSEAPVGFTLSKSKAAASPPRPGLASRLTSALRRA